MAFYKVLAAALLLGLATLQTCQGQSRIIGGSPVLNARYPYFAELRIVYTENGEQLVVHCGGALITSELVLVGSMKCKTHGRVVP
jgi:secreted trypsin-like serine protease